MTNWLETALRFMKFRSLKPMEVDLQVPAGAPFDKRIYERFGFQKFERFHAKTSSGRCFEILDLSYGGLALVSDGKETTVPDLQECAFDIQIFHRHRRCLATHVNTRQGVLGYSFVHTGVESLLFLRSLLEPFKTGGSMRPMMSEFGAGNAQASRIMLRGLGPSDITMISEDGGPSKIKEGTLNYLKDGHYREVKFRRGHISTRGSLEGENVSDSGKFMQDDIDYDDLLNATLILMGAAGAMAHEMLDDWIAFNCRALKAFELQLQCKP